MQWCAQNLLRVGAACRRLSQASEVCAAHQRAPQLIRHGKCFATYTVQVKDRAMLAHSFQGEEFGPAQQLHGMTAVVYAAYIGDAVEPKTNTLLDIGDGFGMLSRAIDPYRYKNLDDLDEFQGQNTTVERICRSVWESICKELQASGGPATHLVKRLRIRIEETDVALAEYEAEVPYKQRHFVIDLASLCGRTFADEHLSTLVERHVPKMGIGSAESKCMTTLLQKQTTLTGRLASLRSIHGHAGIEAMYESISRDRSLIKVKSDGLLRKQLEKVMDHADVQWWIGSNWPRPVIQSALQSCGLASVPFHILCPMSCNSWTFKGEKDFMAQLPGSGLHVFETSDADAAALQTKDGVQQPQVTQVDGTVETMALVADVLGVAPRSYRMSKDDYLIAKEKSDVPSLNSEVLSVMKSRLMEAVEASGKTEVRVLDLGAGMLSMLPIIASTLGSKKDVALYYSAVDWDASLLAAAAVRLSTDYNAVMTTTKNEWQFQTGAGMKVTVALHAADVVEVLRQKPVDPFSLILGCSILDLVPVKDVAEALQANHSGALVYFPIHYAGDTTFIRGHNDLHALTVSYNESLVARGQISHVSDMLPLLGDQIVMGQSTWILSMQSNEALYKQLLSFMATNAMGYHPPSSIARAVRLAVDPEEDCELRIENVDFLGVVPPVAASTKLTERVAVEFTSPGVVQVVTERLPARAPGQALVNAICSAVSAGTESRILAKGIPPDQALDVSLSSMSSTGSAWPLRYGYCLVGRIEDSDTLLTNTRVFCFHPHASKANVAESDLLVVPQGLTDEDATFFANMETAVSLVQDAAPVVGDDVAVFGAGVVGRLVTAVLASSHKVTVFEPDASKRRDLEKHFPRIATADPGESIGEFDVCIEVSGATAGLASALRNARYGGKVVAASIYNEEAGPLPLGLQFHRSAVTLVSSQVSRVSPALTSRWSKERRADLVWELLEKCKPHRWIPLEHVLVQDAAEAYGRLTTGKLGSKQLLFTY